MQPTPKITRGPSLLAGVAEPVHQDPPVPSARQLVNLVPEPSDASDRRVACRWVFTVSGQTPDRDVVPDIGIPFVYRGWMEPTFDNTTDDEWFQDTRPTDTIIHVCVATKATL